ncbi:unnamed protein product [Dicrocoelium dendriticum]|nr:unnamed protein product [Dicrocoelium dendriticum]CAH8493172.1 unnamed protein product [Dicrocoelium dendriticum]
MDGRALSELKVADLRRELEKRHKDKSGVKQVLVDRLREALEEDGHDPANYKFGADDVGGDSEFTEQLSLNDEESETDKAYVKDSDLPRSDSTAEPGETKKLTDESVTYVVQVGDAEEDLDYDLKTEVDKQVDDSVGSARHSANNAEKHVDGDIVTLESGKSVKSAPNTLPKTPSTTTSSESRRNLWVSNLPKTAKAADLKQQFSKAGKVISATIVMSTRSPGGCFGFLQMGSSEEAEAAARKFNGIDFHGHKINVEATDRKPPTLSTKVADRPTVVRNKGNLSKAGPTRSNAQSRILLARRFAGAKRGVFKRTLRKPVYERRRELQPVRPSRLYSNLMAYHSLRRARLLAASRFALPRVLQDLERPATRNRVPRIPLPMARYSAEFLPSVRRFAVPERRVPRSPGGPESGPRHSEPRAFSVNARRRSQDAYYTERSRPIISPRNVIARRSEPVRPIRLRDSPFVSPLESRRYYQPTPSSVEQAPRYARNERSSEGSRVLSRTADYSRPRAASRSADRRNVARMSANMSNGTRRRTPPQVPSYNHFRDPVSEPSPPQRRVPSRSHSSKGVPMQARREYRDVSRSPPRSRNVALVRPYPDVSPRRPSRNDRDRSPIHGGGSRPRVVDYGHRSEPQMNWNAWRGDFTDMPAPSGHTWKPTGHSMLSNYGSRDSGRRY